MRDSNPRSDRSEYGFVDRCHQPLEPIVRARCGTGIYENGEFDLVNRSQEIERACVARLLAALGRPAAALESLSPPAPDVRATFHDGSVEVFEVTAIHPDEVPGRGSAVRSAEARYAKKHPGTSQPTWIQPNPMPAIRHRIEEKVGKAEGYMLRANETLSLLLVGSLAQEGAVAATFVFSFLVKPEQLNQLDEILGTSRFQHAYLHLQLSGNQVWEWTRSEGWHVLRPAT
jgi:hypothetical protein